jgi:hypothetical protein
LRADPKSAFDCGDGAARSVVDGPLAPRHLVVHRLDLAGEDVRPGEVGELRRDACRAVDDRGGDADREIASLVVEPSGEGAPDVQHEVREQYRRRDRDVGVGERPREQDGRRRVAATDEDRGRLYTRDSERRPERRS